jgi:hypothetical protein
MRGKVARFLGGRAASIDGRSRPVQSSIVRAGFG